MRLDRFITLNVARPLHSAMACLLPSPHWGESEVLPVLMYHSISRHDESHVGDYYKLCTSPDRFRLQMETLRKKGYVGVDLETGLQHLRESGRKIGAPVSDPACFGKQIRDGLEPSAPMAVHGNDTSPGLGARSALNHQSRRSPAEVDQPPVAPKPSGGVSTLNSQPSTIRPRPIVLTFDDGSRDFHTEALPILAEFGFTATMFLPTNFIQDSRRAFKKTECLTWPEVRECRKFGIRFGSHTVSHPKLYDLPWADIESEVRDSRSDIEAHLGEPVASFAYPYAYPQADQEFCRRFRETLVASGYQSCVTTIVGRIAKGDDPFALRRLPVNGEDDPTLLLAKVSGSYDWVAPAQLAAKRFKGMFANGSRKGARNP